MSRGILAGLLLSALTLPGISRSDSAVSIEFNGATFVLKYHKTLRNGVINEYFLPTESVESWTQLISVQWFAELDDHRTAVGDLIKTLLGYNPQARYDAWKSDDGLFTGVDFLTWQGDQYVEFNIFVYRAHSAGRGLVAQQYAARAYGEDRRAFMAGLDALRNEMLEKVMGYRFPEVIAE